MTTLSLRRRSHSPAVPLADRTLHQVIQIFKLLADDLRLRILLMLAREGEMNVSTMCELLDQSQPAISHHLTLLRMANLIDFRRDGKFNYYYLDGYALGDTLERLFAEAGRGQTMNFGDFTLAFTRTLRRR
jgi:ArsR family transcriptional regulator